MEGGKNSHNMLQDSWIQYEESESTSSSSIGEDSDASNGSSITSSDTVDDASSSSSSLNSSRGGAIYDLSEIMDQLPIKRGLSQFYQGKSESFTSISRVASFEDLVKKAATPFRRNLKASKSCGTGLHSYKQYTLPKATIAKRSPKGVASLSSFPSKRGGVINTKPPLTPHLEC
ncbi:protein OXIDATIVE STRESS 3 LIKE 2-like [Salvia hispanica]|uniref:protein OXIDATIVE STRESS 3 LIKE 2-like n=1 Tax=Salvia hispanica TaxID=49212 RepID=UPI002009CAF5|nr:protein OXIDATIVE STRESS 3 LIKE 2-like [Salvia hispanica]